MSAILKPMLASPADFDTLKFPLCASVKLDGIRVTVQNNRLYSRSLKPIPNLYLQDWLRVMTTLPLEGMDGELIVGAPNDPATFRTTTSHVMAPDKRNFEFTFHVFDLIGDPGAYLHRWKALKALCEQVSWEPRVVLHRTVIINTQIDLDAYEAQALDLGYEGVMVRDPKGLYKHGRSTTREGALLKVKRHADIEATVIGFEERQHNGNERFENELGRGARSSSKAGKTGLGTLGALTVRGLADPYKDVSFSVGTGFDDHDRALLWADQANLVGRIAKIKYFPMGAKDKPRHPVFAGFRDPLDTSEDMS